MDQAVRNKLRNVVTQCRKLLEQSVAETLQGQFGIFASGKKGAVKIEDEARMLHLSEEDRVCRKDLIDHLQHVEALGYKPQEALAQLVREIAFTHLNRLCAYKMMEARGLIREAVSRGVKSQGFLFYLADHSEDEKRYNSGQQDVAYRHFLDWLGGTLSVEIGVLFNTNDPANRLHPPQRVLDQVIGLLNGDDIKPDETDFKQTWPEIWSQDETIGWVYQYFTPKELRDQARKESAAPRNSYELAFRNQFYTPRYVVEFLTDNTLGRIWYEMRQGNTKLKDQCHYMVRRPDEIFFSAMTSEAHEHFAEGCGAVAKLLLEGDEASFPPFDAGDNEGIQRMIDLAHCVDAYMTKGEEWGEWFATARERIQQDEYDSFTTEDLLDYLFLTCRADRHGGDGSVYEEPWFANTANEIRRRTLSARAEEATQEELLKAPQFIPYRPKKDPRALKILDPACGSGHFLLYCFDLLQTIYEEAYDDEEFGPALQEDYPTIDELRHAIPGLILARNLHGIDIDLRSTQIAALALWLRCQRAYQELGMKEDRPQITRSNIVCAEPMPGEKVMLREFVSDLRPKVLGQFMEVLFDKMSLAGEAGSLLKIEEELRDVVAGAKRQWQEGPKPEQLFLFELRDRKREQRTLFDVSEVTNEQFWEEVEATVLSSLRAYTTQAGNGRGLQRRLFVDDAVRGFSFIDLCRTSFDCVLMNPPFGLWPDHLFHWAQSQYKGGHNDVYAAFLMRTASLVASRGFVGVISSNSFIRGKQLELIRRKYLISSVSLVCDLGLGVMDDAWVESAAYTISSSPSSDILFLDLREELNKATPLLHLAHSLSQTHRVHVHSRCIFETMPRTAMLYDVSNDQLQHVGTTGTADPLACTARKGLTTFDNERFVRLWWECDPKELGRTNTWILFTKGGEFELFYQPLTLAVKWCGDGHELMEKNREVNGQVAQARQGSSLYFLPALTFPTRSELGFCAKLHPRDCIYSSNGPVIVPTNGTDLYYLLGFFTSSVVRYLLDSQAHRRSYSPGLIRRISWREAPDETVTVVRKCAIEAARAKAHYYSTDETLPEFALPPALISETTPLSFLDIERQVKDLLAATSGAVLSAVDGIDNALVAVYGPPPGSAISSGGIGSLDRLNCTWDSSDVCQQMISYALGVVLGRWDVRRREVVSRATRKKDLADPIPACPPAMLTENDGLPVKAMPPDYPFSIDWDGILVDDTDHHDDVIGNIRSVFELIWSNYAEAIEGEACERLGIKRLRDYFRKPGKGGFWDDHVKRYSKSRRKAPIYWLLQSSKKNYALWLYYHRLDRDMLFKALVNYVEPKIRLEENRLDSLRAHKSSGGSKKLDRDIEKQEDLLSELRDFEEKLRRAANLHLEPDLNDGVVLNIAPLWELVPWKEAKTYWEELLAGEYEWSTIGKQLRERGLVE